MRLLLDTHVLLWWLDGGQKLNKKAFNAITNGRNQIYLSAVSIFEIANKRLSGKLRVPDTIQNTLETSQFLPLPVTATHAWKTGELPTLHNDPFDRLLIAQAQLENLTLVTRDENIQRYPVALLEA